MNTVFYILDIIIYTRFYILGVNRCILVVGNFLNDRNIWYKLKLIVADKIEYFSVVFHVVK